MLEMGTSGLMSGLCQERALRRDAVRKMRVVPRSRLVGGGFKLPEAASAKSRGGERFRLKGVT